jgi:hypothetical protein
MFHLSCPIDQNYTFFSNSIEISGQLRNRLLASRAQFNKTFRQVKFAFFFINFVNISTLVLHLWAMQGIRESSSLSTLGKGRV